MAVLTRDKIKEYIRLGYIEIDPIEEDQIGPASVDLRLGGEIRRFKKSNEIIEITETTDYTQYTEKIKIDNGYLLLPGEMILGITMERIKLPPFLCGRLDGRSRFARLGLTMHITAGFMQPGIDNRQVLEIFNASPEPLKLFPGIKICQFVFEKTEGEAIYTGIFQNQQL